MRVIWIAHTFPRPWENFDLKGENRPRLSHFPVSPLVLVTVSLSPPKQILVKRIPHIQLSYSHTKLKYSKHNKLVSYTPCHIWTIYTHTATHELKRICCIWKLVNDRISVPFSINYNTNRTQLYNYWTTMDYVCMLVCVSVCVCVLYTLNMLSIIYTQARQKFTSCNMKYGQLLEINYDTQHTNYLILLGY